jgi:hypothetical protein
MPFEAPSRAAAVRYASVHSGLDPRTGGGKPTDGTGRSGYVDRPSGFVPLTWYFRIPLIIIVSFLTGLGGPQSREPHVPLDPALQPRFPARQPVFDEVPPAVQVTRANWVPDVGAGDHLLMLAGALEDREDSGLAGSFHRSVACRLPWYRHRSNAGFPSVAAVSDRLAYVAEHGRTRPKQAPQTLVTALGRALRRGTSEVHSCAKLPVSRRPGHPPVRQWRADGLDARK